MIKITKKYLFLILLGILPLLSGCGTFYGFKARTDENKNVAPLPATRLDLLCLIGGSIFHEGARDNPAMYAIVPLCSLADLPFSITTDVICFPYDAYFLFKPAPRSELCYAVDENEIEKVKSLLEAGADPNKNTPLLVACCNNNIEMAKLLLAHKANVNPGCNESPLLVACHNNNIEMAKLLLAHKADVDAGYYEFPLLTACCYNNYEGSIEMVQLLLNHGANVNHPPLTARLFNTRNIEIIKLLIKYKVDLNALSPSPFSSSGSSEQTSLMNVLERNHRRPKKTIEIMTLLIENGADVNLYGKYYNEDETVLDTAIAKRSSKKVIEFLRSKGAKTAEELKAEKEKKKK